jgi:hypothetical protein
VFAAKARHNDLELARQHNVASHPLLTSFVQNVAGANCSCNSVGLDPLDLGGRENRERFGLAVRCVYQWQLWFRHFYVPFTR